MASSNVSNDKTSKTCFSCIIAKAKWANTRRVRFHFSLFFSSPANNKEYDSFLFSNSNIPACKHKKWNLFSLTLLQYPWKQMQDKKRLLSLAVALGLHPCNIGRQQRGETTFLLQYCSIPSRKHTHSEDWFLSHYCSIPARKHTHSEDWFLSHSCSILQSNTYTNARLLWIILPQHPCRLAQEVSTTCFILTLHW